MLYLITHCSMILRGLLVNFHELFNQFQEKAVAIITKKFLTCFWHLFQNSSFLVLFSLRNPSYDPTWNRKSSEDLPRKIYEMEPRILHGKCSFICFFISLHYLDHFSLTADFFVSLLLFSQHSSVSALSTLFWKREY